MAKNSGDVANDGRRDYEVGYGKPPKRTQFKPGQSGNPKGRRTGSQNFKSHVCSALNERIAVTQDGRRQVVTKLKLIATQLVNSAVKGNLKSMEFLIRFMDIMDASPGPGANGPVLTDDLRQKISDFFSSSDTDEVGNDNSQ